MMTDLARLLANSCHAEIRREIEPLIFDAYKCSFDGALRRFGAEELEDGVAELSANVTVENVEFTSNK